MEEVEREDGEEMFE